MKKIIKMLLMAFMITGCEFNIVLPQGNNNSKTSSSSISSDNYVIEEDKVLVDESCDGWLSRGEHIANGITTSWEYNTNDFDALKMKPVSFKDVKKISEDVASSLSNRKLKHLYTSTIEFGAIESSWTCKALVNGEAKTLNGNYSFKVTKVDIVENNEHFTTMWIPDFYNVNCETLTPDTLFMPSFQEELSEYDKAVCIGGKGVYQLIAAEYYVDQDSEVSEFGLALVKHDTEDSLNERERHHKVLSNSSEYIASANNHQEKPNQQYVNSSFEEYELLLSYAALIQMGANLYLDERFVMSDEFITLDISNDDSFLSSYLVEFDEENNKVYIYLLTILENDINCSSNYLYIFEIDYEFDKDLAVGFNFTMTAWNEDYIFRVDKFTNGLLTYLDLEVNDDEYNEVTTSIYQKVKELKIKYENHVDLEGDFSSAYDLAMNKYFG